MVLALKDAISLITPPKPCSPVWFLEDSSLFALEMLYRSAEE